MLIVINREWGGFHIPDELVGEFDSKYDDSMEVRTCDLLVNWADSHRGPLKVVEIPSEATDFRIEDYDGMETVWYVLDGKMHSIY